MIPSAPRRRSRSPPYRDAHPGENRLHTFDFRFRTFPIALGPSGTGESPGVQERLRAPGVGRVEPPVVHQDRDPPERGHDVG